MRDVTATLFDHFAVPQLIDILVHGYPGRRPGFGLVKDSSIGDFALSAIHTGKLYSQRVGLRDWCLDIFGWVIMTSWIHLLPCPST